jgi:hypothetical protein
MADVHPVATHHLPSFITAPGETDTLMVIMSIFLAVAVLSFGILFLRLHTLPERMAHKSHKLQFEIVAVLGLIALFTHMHIFWVAGLLLAMIDLPDFGTSLGRIAGSVEKMAGLEPGGGMVEIPPDSQAGIKQTERTADPQGGGAAAQGNGSSSPQKIEIAPIARQEPTHA